jgi:hypothetical protein
MSPQDVRVTSRSVRPLVTLAAFLAAATLAAGCGGGGSEGSSAPVSTTPESVKLTIYEHSLSECKSYRLKDLAHKYSVDPNWTKVSRAVGTSWAKMFKAGADAKRSGRDGCLQGVKLK